MQNNHGICDEQVISQTDDSVEMKIEIPADCDYFDGHFPDFKLLPAVAQFEIATRFSRKYFKTTHKIAKIPRMKFSSPILPGVTVLLKLEINREKQLVKFEFSSTEKPERIYSTGSFLVESGC